MQAQADCGGLIHTLKLEKTVFRVGDTLSFTLEMQNNSPEELKFSSSSSALHTYALRKATGEAIIMGPLGLCVVVFYTLKPGEKITAGDKIELKYIEIRSEENDGLIKPGYYKLEVTLGITFTVGIEIKESETPIQPPQPERDRQIDMIYPGNPPQRTLAVFPDQDGVIYGILPNGNLQWYKNSRWLDGEASWVSEQGQTIGTGWQDFRQVFSAGEGVIYGITNSNKLMWYKNKGWHNGAIAWVSGQGTEVGNSWKFKQVFSAGDSVIYGVTFDGDLMWHRHLGWQTGQANWLENQGRCVGSGWQEFMHIFSGDDGVIYAIKLDGQLCWYKNEEWRSGGASWVAPSGTEISTGWQAFSQVFSAGSGVIYAIAFDGKLLWHKHVGQQNGRAEWTINHGRSVGMKWGDFLSWGSTFPPDEDYDRIRVGPA